ncbi:MAG: hypothetical protein AAF215_18655 [Cyanobacteria bacterium P01_A01_bin.123]
MVSANHTQKHKDELLPEYRLDYQKAKPNRFAVSDKSQNLTVVVLDEDVAQVFKTPESVNKVLRALIKSMPQSTGDETA